MSVVLGAGHRDAGNLKLLGFGQDLMKKIF